MPFNTCYVRCCVLCVRDVQFGTHVKKKEHKLYGAFAKDLDPAKKATKITFEDSD